MSSGPAAPVGSVAVIGAGLAGLSAAMHLRAAGVHVTVLEAAAAPGGRAARTNRAGFSLDVGPTVITLPDVLADCFAALGEELSDHLRLLPVDPAYVARMHDGSTLALTTDVEVMAERVRAFSGPRDADGYLRLVAHLRAIYRAELPHFIDRNLDSPLSLVNRPLLDIVRLRGFSRLAKVMASFFEDERLRRAFGFQAMYAGVAPSSALGLFAVITAMDLIEGVVYPVGGINAVPTAMATALESHGVEIRYGTTVSSVREDTRDVLVTDADGRSDRYDSVVLTCEPEAAATLLGDHTSRTLRRRRQMSPSCVVLAAGVDHRLPVEAHHTIHLGRAWDEVFVDLAEGRPMRDPSFLVSVPTRTDPSIAPAGGDVLYALFPTPHLRHQHPLDWRRLRAPYREHMLHHLAAAGMGDLSGSFEVEELITPDDWRRRGFADGTPLSAAHTFMQTGPFRTPNRLSSRLVLAGSGTTPGIGVPMVLISGRLAAERLVGRDPSYRSRAWR
ncbi:phytoene desaturase family protein [Luteipulveratus mongoliensis]|uniref:Amine oxidase domain-containing protein n=1 Tax=Luteipulveratus mongoliensis TaxID=571913 RepID=A0A0K1JK87_9MICO|nr:phytoene desaturase family protein [Luteipulveratus mongoliensis]AKU17132.1 hypothetical protein VV02_16830 [Luteipulveratus mongoliensis]